MSPGPVSDSNPGTPDHAPYVPAWCYDPPGPRICVCGCHEGFHNDAGVCLNKRLCNCPGFDNPGKLLAAVRRARGGPSKRERGWK